MKCCQVQLSLGITLKPQPASPTHTNTHTSWVIGWVGARLLWMVNRETEITSWVGLCCVPWPLTTLNSLHSGKWHVGDTSEDVRTCVCPGLAIFVRNSTWQSTSVPHSEKCWKLGGYESQRQNEREIEAECDVNGMHRCECYHRFCVFGLQRHTARSGQ